MRRPPEFQKHRAFVFEGRKWIISRVDRACELVTFQSHRPEDGQLEIRTTTWQHAMQLLGQQGNAQ